MKQRMESQTKILHRFLTSQGGTLFLRNVSLAEQVTASKNMGFSLLRYIII